LVDVSIQGIQTEHEPISVTVPLIPGKFNLSQNYPNPFNPSTNITYTLPRSEDVQIEIINNAGQVKWFISDDQVAAGYHELEFNALNLPSYIYYYRIRAGEYQDVKKMVLIK
jgi:hypothetical protein